MNVSVPQAFTFLLMPCPVPNATHPVSPAQHPDLRPVLLASPQPLQLYQMPVCVPRPTISHKTETGAMLVTAPALLAQGAELEGVRVAIPEVCSLLVVDLEGVDALLAAFTLL